MQEPDAELDELARLVIGAAIAVHSALGPVFLEKVYEEALCVELDHLGVGYERQKRVEIWYRDAKVGVVVVDLVVCGRLVVELKAVDAVHPVHLAQVISYLRALKEPLGLLLNFQIARMKDGIKRVIWSK